MGFSGLSLLIPLVLQLGGGITPLASLEGDANQNEFGTSFITISDFDWDGIPDLLIGAPGKSTLGLTGAGEATIWSTGTQRVLLRIPGQFLGCGLGTRLAVVGDINGDGVPDFGIHAKDSSAGGLGATGWLRIYSGANATPMGTFVGGFGDQLGRGLGRIGDVNGDGFDDLLYGSPGKTFSPTRKGEVRILSGANGAVLLAIKAPTGVLSFGHSVAGVGDLNGDGIPDFAVGAPESNLAVVLSGLDGSPIGNLPPTKSRPSVNYGWEIASVGDFDQDGARDIAVSSPWGNPGTRLGEVRLFSGANFSLLGKINGSRKGEGFGFSIADGGDVDGDGEPDLLVGAPGQPGLSAGTVHAFSGISGREFLHLQGNPGSNLGFSVARIPDMNKDSRPEVGAGAPRENTGGLTANGTSGIWSFNPFMYVDKDTISVAAADSVRMSLDFPISWKGAAYRILMSGVGTGPTLVNGVSIPLSDCVVFQRTVTNLSPLGFLLGGSGTLNINGDGLCVGLGQPGWHANRLGRNYWVCAVAILPGSGALVSAPYPVSVIP